MRPPLLLIAIALSLLVLLGGCDSHAPPPAGSSDCRALPGLARATPPELQTEYLLLIQEQATPVEIDSQAMDHVDGNLESDKHKSGNVKETQNTLIGELDRIFSPFERKRLLQEAESLWPGGEFTFSPVDLEAIRSFNRRNAARRREVIEVLRLKLPLGYAPSQSYVADHGFLDAVTLAHRGEAFAIAECLAAGDVAEAVEALANMFLLDRSLEAGACITLRVAAAKSREQTLQVLAAMVNHPQCTGDTQRRLDMLLARERKAFTSDTQMLRGERAAGLIVYEIARADKIPSLFSAEQFSLLETSHRLEALCRSIANNLNGDEAFYLRTMRAMCTDDLPFYARRQQFEQLARELEHMVDTPDDCYIARTMLLDDVEQALRMAAEDRTRCEAWRLALALSTGDASVEATECPLTGQVFDIIYDNDALQVRSGTIVASVRRPAR